MSGKFWTPELHKWLQPGNSIYELHNDGSKALIHIRAIVDDEWVVTRRWDKHRMRWAYKIDWIYLYYLMQVNDELQPWGK